MSKYISSPDVMLKTHAHLDWGVLQSCALHVTGIAPEDIIRDAADAVHEDAAACETDVVVPQVCPDSLKNLNAHFTIADCAPCTAIR